MADGDKRPAVALVVDDDDSVRLLVRMTLETVFKEVDVASHGEQGVSAIQSRLYDVVVTDLTMPGTSGLAVVRAAKVRNPQATVLVITGFADQDDEIAVAELGAQLLRKPFGVSELLVAVERAGSAAALSLGEA